MSTKITADNGAEIQVGQLGITVDHPEGIASIWARLSHEQRSALADALAPGRQGWTLADLARLRATLANPTAAGGQWTRDDLPSLPNVLGEITTHERGEGAAAYRTAALAHLNAHHPKPGHPMGTEAARWRRERDEALRKKGEMVDRAVRAEQEREEIADQFATFRAEIVAEAVKARKSAVTRADIKKTIRDTLPMSDPDGMWAATAHAQTREVCNLLGIEAEQTADPVEEQTDALADILYGDEMVTDQMRGVLERVVRAGMLFPSEATSDE
ncbi:hypothetical protein OVA21_04045 [Dietzia sp. SL131]|uniref:hypothetical protein n=1 Tax=Dietzia sp. SL131 TaxID=2995149 RepID=UPI00227BBA76|nr:hypothetical protein [Dietzia sp. SL131]MCY1656393.1 hypothetical protein [Dietzia sp. SL131]